MPADGHLFFQPSAERARLLDREMRSSLASSIAYLADELRPHLRVDQEQLKSFLARLEEAPTAPLTFAIYWDLVRAVEADDLEAAGPLLDHLLQQPAWKSKCRIFPLGDRFSEPEAERYARFIDSDPSLPIDLHPPPPVAAQRTEDVVQRALCLMQKGDPELAAEIDELLREVILCAGRPQPGRPTFDGASCFMLWGAILINAERDGTDLSMVEMLAHESAHNLLFGLSANERLLNNDPAECYPSPLRIDPRPLEGIYHATFVSARMFRAMKQLAVSGILSAEDQQHAVTEAARDKKAFLDGAATLERHGDFTPTGRAILESAQHFVASN